MNTWFEFFGFITLVCLGLLIISQLVSIESVLKEIRDKKGVKKK